MALPDPEHGLVIGYSYLWRDEALAGLEEGRKDRPAVIVLSVEDVLGRRLVTVAPITHLPPARPQFAIEIPAATKQRLGLDGERSWIIATDLNTFAWPGYDLRPTRKGGQIFHYGFIPGKLYERVVQTVLELRRRGMAAGTSRGG